LKHVPWRRLLFWRPSAHEAHHTDEVAHAAREGDERPGSLRPHDPADLARAAATDREAIETRLGRRHQRR